MKIFADYHTHTIYSHGKGTIEDNVKRAIEIGLKAIAITDHGPAHVFYGMRKKDFKKMRDEIDRLKEKYPQIEILMGVEANLISTEGDIDASDDLLKYLDILLVGYHTGILPKSFKDAVELFAKNMVSKYTGYFKEEVREKNTEAMVKAIKKYKIDIIAHPGAKVDIDTRKLARAAKEKGTVLEINSSHGYLTVEYVKIAKEEGCKFVINSDAHTPLRVGDFRRGIEIAKKAGLTEEDVINAKR